MSVICITPDHTKHETQSNYSQAPHLLETMENAAICEPRLSAQLGTSNSPPPSELAKAIRADSIEQKIACILFLRKINGMRS